MPTEFLVQQMSWREALEDASGLDELEKLSSKVNTAEREALQKCEQLLDVQHNPAQAVQQVRALMFIERFANDVQARLDQLDTQGRGQ